MEKRVAEISQEYQRKIRFKKIWFWVILSFLVILFAIVLAYIYLKQTGSADSDQSEKTISIFGTEITVPIFVENQSTSESSSSTDSSSQASSGSLGSSSARNINTGSSSVTAPDTSSSSTVPSPASSSSSSALPESLSVLTAFYADSQTDSSGDETNHRAVVDKIMATSASYVVHAGDLMEDGTQASLDSFNSVTATMRSEKQFYSALGNNDRKIGDASTPSSLYLANFSYPNNEQWYSVNAGNLHIVILDSAFSSGSAAQLSWLDSDLQSAASQSRITVVVYHHPTFASTVMSYLVDYGVDFVVAGHVHAYSHTETSGIDFFNCSGQTSIGYLLAYVYDTYAIIKSYNSSGGLIEAITVQER